MEFIVASRSLSPPATTTTVFLDDDVGAGGGEPGHSCQDDGDNADNESWISGTGGLQLGSVVEKSSEDERACGGGQVLDCEGKASSRDASHGVNQSTNTCPKHNH